MSILICGLIIFIAIHLVPASTSRRHRLVSVLGENKYKGIFTVFSLIGLGLIILGKANADFVAVYDPVSWGRQAAWVMMLPVFYLLACANMVTNVKRFTRHPMLWGVCIWSVVHLLANGDLASLILFGTMGAWALVSMYLGNLRGDSLLMSAIPVRRDVTALFIAIGLYAVVALAHPWLFGVPAFV